jgi:hypothetical protein
MTHSARKIGDMVPRIRPMFAGARVAGSAFTVTTRLPLADQSETRPLSILGLGSAGLRPHQALGS